MIKKFWNILIVFYLLAHPAYAYEFTKVSEFFNVVQNDYIESPDLQKTSLIGLEALSQIDSSFHLYHSDTKAFLYYQKNLMATLDLPTDKKDAVAWGKFTNDVLNQCLTISPNLAAHTVALESLILELMTRSLDDFSRVDKLPSAHIVSQYDVKNDIVYIKPTLFFSGISDDIKNLISSYADLDGIILDLRGCKGGNFNEALKTADLFLDGALIAYSADNKHIKKFYNATPGDILNGKPIAILTDSYTASAAELVTAALSEQSRATIIGTKTYGKNSIQDLYQFNDQILFLTSGYFYTPSGKSIHQVGLMPQICTGVDNSCLLPDTKDSLKDIKIATKLIKKNFS